MYTLEQLYNKESYSSKLLKIVNFAREYSTNLNSFSLTPYLKDIENFFNTLNQEEKLKFCSEFINLKNQLLEQYLVPLQKVVLIKIANILNPFYSAYRAKKIYQEFQLDPNPTINKVGKYNSSKNNCRHFIFNLSVDLYSGLIGKQDLDWKKSAKTSKPFILRIESKELKKIPKSTLGFIVYFGNSIPKKEVEKNLKEGDIIWIERKNGTYHVGIVTKDENKPLVIDFTGKINKKSIKDFCKNAKQIKLYRITLDNFLAVP
ncbi:MAG: hypothetical protein ACK4J0_01855 [Candidatus Anstonellaceae archaeon]